jgi:hypothetical protein
MLVLAHSSARLRGEHIMAKRRAATNKNGTTKSASIRAYREAHPTATPKEIEAGLGAEGLTVSRQFISNILSNDKKKRRKRGRPAGKVGRPKGKVGRPAGKVGRPAMSDSVSLSALVTAKKLADQLGGVDNAKGLLDALVKLG